MSMLLRVAFRNVLRNRRRTFLSVIMIAAGIAAIVVFRGFAHNLMRKLQWVAINTQYGHLQMAHEKTWNLSAKDKPKDRLIAPVPEIVGRIAGLDGVSYVSGRIAFYAMVNNGEESVSARGVGFDPEREIQMRDSMRVVEGRNLRPDSRFEIILGQGLRDQIGMRVGDAVTLMAYTYDGSVNALDAELVGIFQSGLAEVDNSTFFLPLKIAQNLLDTDQVERLVVQLGATEDTEKVQASLGSLPEGWSSKTWQQMAVYYRQVVEYFNMQNLIIQWILMILALLAIGNIVGMSIAERTGEIGTLRAMGDSRGEMLTQFLLEGLILGVFGGIAGCALGFTAGKALNLAKIPITTPGASLPLPMEVDLLPATFLGAALAMCLMAVVATLIPALRASRIEIVEALKRNI